MRSLMLGGRRADNTNTGRTWSCSGRGKLVEEDPVLVRRLARCVLPAVKSPLSCVLPPPRVEESVLWLAQSVAFFFRIAIERSIEEK